MDTHATLAPSLNSAIPGSYEYTAIMGGLDETKPVIVVAVVGIVPVAVRRTHIVRIVVPGAAAQHALHLLACSL